MSRLTRRLLVAAAATALAVTASTLTRNPADAAVTLPPAHAKFDYQIGGAYTPPAGVQVVTRDRTATPAAGLYNICYVNAFQVQPGEQGQWGSDLLLRDAKGNLVIDEDWGEPLLDLRTADKRNRIAAKVNGWIDGCAGKGYKAIEPDNYDSYTRSKNLLTAGQAKAYLTLLATHAHSKSLAIGQKNTVELAGDRTSVGLDFAVAEECGQYDECGDYVDAFGNNVIVIEYTDNGRRTACSQYGGTLSIVQRDVDVSVPGDSGYVRKTC
ncbi:endo alpha-1,4 polygalactosaminidase [Kribbella soli]|uniref:endo alpha-1,4 polygalactosaminidase n=1 Tax=Kribbella soli TaxID=1124743 RepID=UPI001EDE2F3A|nr:endo alpha-1,4 polygalactosaminidase [Kribbella soli]